MLLQDVNYNWWGIHIIHLLPWMDPVRKWIRSAEVKSIPGAGALVLLVLLVLMDDVGVGSGEFGKAGV